MKNNLYENYLTILKEELVPAMGCTEPIAIAYAASLARKYFDGVPTKVNIDVSGNIIKNVKSVIVPNTNGLKGIIAAVSSGIIAGDSDLVLEVISKVSQKDLVEIKEFMFKTSFSIKEAKTNNPLDISIELLNAEHSSKVRIVGSHTNVVLIEKDNEFILKKDFFETRKKKNNIRRTLTIEDIVKFADTLKIEDVEEIFSKQINYNLKIAKEGLKNSYGAEIGRIILEKYGDSILNKAKAYSAAGSDARMSGCDLPVVINSGSGNQGLTASLPVIIYAQELKVDKETLYRALAVSNLVTIHLKTGIGTLSAYCGATSAGVGAGAGIYYLYGGRFEEISHSIVNGLVINSGMICDGAKPSCAAKIASAVEAGILGMEMYKKGNQFFGGDGIVAKGVEKTIENINTLASKGMKSTDTKIIKMMISDC